MYSFISFVIVLINKCQFLTPCDRIRLEKLTVTQLVKKFPAFYGNRRFITVFTGPCHEPDASIPQPATLFPYDP